MGLLVRVNVNDTGPRGTVVVSGPDGRTMQVRAVRPQGLGHGQVVLLFEGDREAFAVARATLLTDDRAGGVDEERAPEVGAQGEEDRRDAARWSHPDNAGA